MWFDVGQVLVICVTHRLNTLLSPFILKLDYTGRAAYGKLQLFFCINTDNMKVMQCLPGVHCDLKLLSAVTVNHTKRCAEK